MFKRLPLTRITLHGIDCRCLQRVGIAGIRRNRVWRNTSMNNLQCLDCQFLLRVINGKSLQCKAFPYGIPT